MTRLAMILLLAGCATPPKLVQVPTHIPASLLTACHERSVAIKTARDLAGAYIERGLALRCANGKIVAIGRVVNGRS